jgi:hypothetical protein
MATTSKRIIFWIICIVAIFIFGSLTGTILYYYRHPSAIKGLIERSLSTSTGTSFKIKDLAYSIQPLSIEARGITVEPGNGQHGFYLEIPDLKADMVLAGRFGHKNLSLTSLKIAGFSVRVSRDMALPEISPIGDVPSSLLSRVLKRMISVFLFREVTFQATEVVDGEVTFQSGDQSIDVYGIQARLIPEQGVDISCSARAEWTQEKMRLMAPRIHIMTDDGISLADSEIKARLRAQECTFQSMQADISGMELESILIYDHDHKRLAFDPVALRVEGITLRQGTDGKPISLNLELRTKGHINFSENQVEVSQFHLAARDLLQVSGQLNLDFGAKDSVKITHLEGRLMPQEWFSLLPHEMGRQLAPFSLSGPVNLSARIEGIKDQGVWHWQGDVGVQLNNNPYAYVTEQIRSTGRVTGRLRAEGPFPGMGLSVRLQGDEITFSGKGVTLQPFKARLSLSGKHPLHHIEEIYVDMPQATLAMGSRDVQIYDIQVHARKGSVQAETGFVSLPEVQLTSSLLQNLCLSLSIDREDVVTELKGEDIHLVQSLLALGLVPPGWQFTGLDSLYVRATLKDKDRCGFIYRLGFRDFTFQDRDGVYMGEKIAVRAESVGEINLKRSDVTIDSNLKVDGGEILWDRFYLNLGKTPVCLSFSGMYGMQAKSLQLSKVHVGLKDVFGLDMHGSILDEAPSPSIDLSAKIPETALNPIFYHFVSEPFRRGNPLLASMHTEGSVSADIRLTGRQNDWTATGNFTWHEGKLSSGDDGFSLQGITLDLPLWYQTRKDASAEKTVKGRLSIQSLNLPFLPQQSVSLPLDVGPNRLFVRTPTNLRIPGGVVIVGPLVCQDLFDAKPSIETNLTANDIEINALLSEIWSSPMQGTINGQLDPIRFEGSTLTSHGEIRAKLMRGAIVVSDIGASNPFTSGPVFKLNAEWEDLSLAELTTGTSFGRVEGILQGRVQGLEIAYGQPQAFDLLLETVETKGVPQKISVRAVDNIAQIGGGQSPFMGLAGSFASLFKEFPYEKIGVHASLDNDIFRINGTIREGGTEYLVKRGRFSGVNVVNQNPDNRVRFKDMVKRIRRVTDSKTGPVVK